MNEIKQVVDPAFLRISNYSYVDYSDEKLTSVLCFAIARHKQDLILHQQRIELFAKDNNDTLLFSALVDLFTALKKGGCDYKKRMFTKYKNLITTKQASILAPFLNTDLPAIASINDLKESVINLGLQGETLSSKHITQVPI